MIDEKSTSTHKRIGGPLDEFFESHDMGHMDLSASEDLLDRLTLIVPEGDAKLTAGDFFKFGLSIAHAHTNTKTEDREVLEEIVGAIAMGAAYLVNEIACKKIEAEMVYESNLAQNKAAKAKVEAERLAVDLWARDAQEELMIGVCAKIVRNDLDRIGFGQFAEETVKRWIRPKAPGYAKRGGRPKKI